MSKDNVMRVTLMRNGRNGEGQVVALPETMEELYCTASDTFHIENNSVVIYTDRGARVNDIRLVRDNDVLYAAEQSEAFKDPQVVLSQGLLTCNELSSTACITSKQWVTLNVGGKCFTTTRNTLTCRDSDSMLARMFGDRDFQWSSAVDNSGAYLIDRSSRYFEPMLNYLRHGKLILDEGLNPEGVLEEAKFFGLTSLIEQLEDIIKANEPISDHTPITRREFITLLMKTPTTSQLRCQGVNFHGADLSKLDLRSINFKSANLSRADLSGANLSFCSLERANLSGAKLDGADLQGVKMVLANLEGASLRGCNFEDPAGSKANMEGVNMKGVDLESSQMAGVNLRVATLKNANLQNCNLRWAVLAGTDLENCNLSGCDLQEANLRGANVKGAAFEEMVTPLHMSQSVR
ncbi:BTB/POZ domain-containing protein KCTD9-like [Ptychodera flava]|uniref:BTB/POZ domain-containing protein KCTD9-like n=1 Tax=Ptychodera flava TaxID=63121 RepID=UPI003969C696